MTDLESLKEITIDVTEELAAVGDRKTLKGSMTVEVRGGYDMVFYPGDEISWSLDIIRISGGIEVKGLIEGRVDLECCRCLKQFEFPCAVNIEEHIAWFGDESEGEEPAEEGDYNVERGVLDLLQVLRDVIGLSFPIRRICSDDCRGLCGVCGQNLNIEDCGCSRGKVDVRLKPLELIKEKLSQKDAGEDDSPEG